MTETEAREWLHINWSHLTVTGKLGEAVARYYKTYRKEVENKVAAEEEKEKKEDEENKTGEWLKTFNGEL